MSPLDLWHVGWAHTCCLQKGSLANLTNIDEFLNKHYNLDAFEQKILQAFKAAI